MHSNFNLLRDGACPLEQEKGIVNSTYTEQNEQISLNKTSKQKREHGFFFPFIEENVNFINQI